LGGITHVIIDESHHAQAPTYRQIKNYWPRAKILGVTATPVDGLSQVFERIILGPSTKWLIDNGRLSKYKYYAPTSGKMNLEDITLSHGEYSLDDLEQRNDSVQLSGQLVDSYLKYAEGGRGIGFAINVEHSKAYADRYSEAGIPAIHLDANTPTEQRFEAFEKLKNNELKMIWNVGLLGEGVDIPALEIMQNAQPTTSLAKYLQRCGRALRAAPGKEYGIMIDHTDDWLTHGLPCRDRQWGLDGVIKQKREKSEAVKKEDGEIVERKKAAELAERVVEEATVELVDIMASSQDPAKIWWDNKLAELLDICRLKNYKKAWVSYRLMDENAPLEVWEMAADKLEYQKGWAYHQHKKMTQLLAGVV
jgi:superfamily II DNA or RNA helicase